MEPLYMQLKVAHDQLLDVACREIKDHNKIMDHADEIARLATLISERSYNELKKDGL